MWRFTRVSNERITFVINTDQLSCAWITRSNKQTPLILRAYKKFPLTNFEITPTSIASPYAIASHIKQFLKNYNMLDAEVTLSIAQSHNTQHIATLSHANPQLNEFLIQGQKHALWDYQYLYPTETNQHVFYVCSINQSLLLQYKLIAIQTNINLVAITTQYAALLTLYSYMYGAAFRRSQLALDMVKYNNKIEHLFNLEMVKRIITYSDHHTDDLRDTLNILTSCGLYISESNS